MTSKAISLIQEQKSQYKAENAKWLDTAIVVALIGAAVISVGGFANMLKHDDLATILYSTGSGIIGLGLVFFAIYAVKKPQINQLQSKEIIVKVIDADNETHPIYFEVDKTWNLETLAKKIATALPKDLFPRWYTFEFARQDAQGWQEEYRFDIFNEIDTTHHNILCSKEENSEKFEYMHLINTSSAESKIHVFVFDKSWNMQRRIERINAEFNSSLTVEDFNDSTDSINLGNFGRDGLVKVYGFN